MTLPHRPRLLARLGGSLLAGLALTAATAFAQSTPTFTVVNTGLDATFGNAGKGVLDPQVKGFVGVAYGNNLFVAVAASTGENVIRWATSPDGTTWTAHSQALPNGTLVTFQTSKIHFLNGKFIFFTGFGDNVGGVAGTTWCYYSTDGLTWTAKKVTDGRANVEEFDASATRLLAAGHNGYQFYSDDLTTWVADPVVANGTGYDHNDAAYANGKFVSTINGFGGAAYSSADAVTWTTIPSLTTPGGARVEAGNGFLIGSYSGNQYKSTDGVTWTKLTLTVPANWIAPGGSPRFTSAGFLATGTFLTTFKTGYMVSGDGVSWTPVGMLPDNPAPGAGFISRYYGYSDIAYGNGTYVIVGQDTSQAAFAIQVMPLVLTIAGSAAPVPPVIAKQPAATLSLAVGASGVLTVEVPGTGLTYQWYKDAIAVAGATSARLILSAAQVAASGSYTVTITGSGGSVTSSASAVTVSATADPGRIVNLSIRGTSGTGNKVLIMGFVAGGNGTSGTAPLLARGVGPSIIPAPYGVTDALTDTQIFLIPQGAANPLATNDDWGNDPALTTAANTTGAFPLLQGSKDAALVSDLAPKPYSVIVSGKANASGSVLAELYDINAPRPFSATSPRLVNISARGYVSGTDTLIAGFVITGQTTKTLLVRAIGPDPTFASAVANGNLADPVLSLYRSVNGVGTLIQSNDNWGGDAQLTAVGTTVGASPLTVPTSKDAALLVTLEPGVYTVQVSGASNSAGITLAEVYDVP